MRVLMSGALSMSGREIARRLVEDGHEVHAFARQNSEELATLDAARSLAERGVALHGSSAHGSESLTDLIESIGPEALVVHAHPMQGFRSWDYSISRAIEEMTLGVATQMAALATGGGRIVAYSGTVFEPDYGSGPPRAGVSPYGVSKLAVFEIFRLAAERWSLDVRKVLIPNPFGRGEKGRFGNYLATCWREGTVPVVRTPRYVRDNIPSRELAARYSSYLSLGAERPDVIRPSGYIESQLDFARRVAREMQPRLGRELEVDAAVQEDFSEPMALVNDGSRSSEFDVTESLFWDEYATMFLDDRGTD